MKIINTTVTIMQTTEIINSIPHMCNNKNK